jgi:hypothetical protein
MIPANISDKDILKAIEKIDTEGYQPERGSTEYDLRYQGRSYPPKVVISCANIYANGVEHPGSLFNGGDETNLFLIDRGFPITFKDQEIRHPFFNRWDLLFFERFAGAVYDLKDNIHRNAREFIRRVLWSKTQYLASQVTSQQPEPFAIKGRQQWNERDSHGPTGQRFKNYTWYRLYHKDIRTERVYYTVGVDSSKGLVIKLDCQRQGKNALQKHIVQTFDAYLRQHGIAWLVFDRTAVETLDWQTLSQHCVDYITRSFETYSYAVALVTSNLDEKCARICWNSNGWRWPSGTEGKAQAGAAGTGLTYEAQYGFAPDEWLFDLDNLQAAGYHYSRLEPLHTERAIHAGKSYNITLFAYNAVEKQWYWIGRIENAEVLSPKESTTIALRYKFSDEFLREVQQLRALQGVNHKAYENMADDNLFNVRFRPEDVQLYDYVPFEAGDTPPSLYYTLADRKKMPEFYTKSDPDGLHLTPGPRRPAGKRIGKQYSGEYKEIDNMHGIIQESILPVLEQLYPADKFFPEGRKIVNRTRIDIVRQTPDGRHIFYEIKTYPNVLYSIRIAVGQLLEYAFYPGQILTTEFYIVTHLAASPVALKFLAHLSRQVGCSFGYIHFDRKTRQIVPNKI